jgi:carbonic anhydrase/acetyltransferase-like protein (isoleucine patch superfamily)
MENETIITSDNFFDLTGFSHPDLFPNDDSVWTALDRLEDFFSGFFKETWPIAGISGQVTSPLVIHNGQMKNNCELRPDGPKKSVRAYINGTLAEGAAIIMPGAYLFDDRIIIGSGSVVEPGALIKGPVIIGDGTEVRHGAYIRGDCLIGNGCVVGHTTEIKGSIMLDGSAAGHFAYIGDSILGKDVNLGAGTKLANLKVIPGSVMVFHGRKRYNTNRRKLGAILGDHTETGCNSVTSPGTLLGPRSIVYPTVAVPGGYYPGRALIAPSKNSLRIQGS